MFVRKKTEEQRFKMNQHKQIYFIIITLLFFGATAFSQTKTGTTIGQFLKIDPGARSSVLNNAAMRGDVISANGNPASVGAINQVQAQFTHSPWLANIDYNYFGVAVPVEGLFNVLLNITSLNSGEMAVRTVEKPLGTGERFDFTAFNLGLGVGFLLTNRIAVGLLVNYISEQIWHSKYQTYAVNLGVQFELVENGPVLGASLSNFGPRTGYNGRDLFIDYDYDHEKYGDNNGIPAELRTDEYALPTIFRVGISYPLQISAQNKLILLTEARHPNDNSESINAAFEWLFLEKYAFRAGYRDLFQTDLEGGLVLGGGMQIPFGDFKVMLDYAYADYGILDYAQRFTIGLIF